MPADRPTCATCRWWGADAYDVERLLHGHDVYVPCCIRSTPNGFPLRKASAWCGEHQPGEARIPCAVHHDRPATTHLVRGHHACAECVAAALDALSVTASAATTQNPTTPTIPADAPASDAGTEHKEP